MLINFCNYGVSIHNFWTILPFTNIIKKNYISCQFCFKIFLVENTYKFCYEKNLQKIAVNFFVKYFV